jgi:hypothetical protein
MVSKKTTFTKKLVRWSKASERYKNSIQTIEVRPLTIEQVCAIFGFNLTVYEYGSKKKWMADIETLDGTSIASGDGSTQLEALKDLTENMKGKEIMCGVIKLKDMMFAHRGTYTRKVK